MSKVFYAFGYPSETGKPACILVVYAASTISLRGLSCRYVRMNLSVERREEIGRRCKLLLDVARIRCLAAAGLDARLVYFVDRDVTPENVAIVAVPRKLPSC